MIRQDVKEFGKLAKIRSGEEKAYSRDHRENAGNSLLCHC